jgi:hypothetical protein
MLKGLFQTEKDLKRPKEKKFTGQSRNPKPVANTASANIFDLSRERKRQETLQ